MGLYAGGGGGGTYLWQVLNVNDKYGGYLRGEAYPREGGGAGLYAAHYGIQLNF